MLFGLECSDVDLVIGVFGIRGFVLSINNYGCVLACFAVLCGERKGGC